MKFGQDIEISGLKCQLPESDTLRHVTIYSVPRSLSPDGFYISVVEAGAIEKVPPSRVKDTKVVARYDILCTGEVQNLNVSKELTDA